MNDHLLNYALYHRDFNYFKQSYFCMKIATIAQKNLAKDNRFFERVFELTKTARTDDIHQSFCRGNTFEETERFAKSDDGLFVSLMKQDQNRVLKLRDFAKKMSISDAVVSSEPKKQKRMKLKKHRRKLLR